MSQLNLYEIVKFGVRSVNPPGLFVLFPNEGESVGSYQARVKSRLSLSTEEVYLDPLWGVYYWRRGSELDEAYLLRLLNVSDVRPWEEFSLELAQMFGKVGEMTTFYDFIRQCIGYGRHYDGMSVLLNNAVCDFSRQQASNQGPELPRYQKRVMKCFHPPDALFLKSADREALLLTYLMSENTLPRGDVVLERELRERYGLGPGARVLPPAPVAIPRAPAVAAVKSSRKRAKS